MLSLFLHLASSPCSHQPSVREIHLIFAAIFPALSNFCQSVWITIRSTSRNWIGVLLSARVLSENVAFGHQSRQAFWICESGRPTVGLGFRLHSRCQALSGLLSTQGVACITEQVLSIRSVLSVVTPFSGFLRAALISKAQYQKVWPFEFVYFVNRLPLLEFGSGCAPSLLGANIFGYTAF